MGGGLFRFAHIRPTPRCIYVCSCQNIMNEVKNTELLFKLKTRTNIDN